MNGCIYRTKDGECDLYSEGGKFQAYCVGDEPCEGRKASKADRIREKSDEELAEWIETIVSCSLCLLRGKSCKGGRVESRASCKHHWLEWLGQEEEIERVK